MDYSRDDTNQQIVSLRKDGMVMRDIATQLSITYEKVKYVLRKENLSSVSYRRTCKSCGKQFTSKASHATFCSEKCRRTYNKANYGPERACSHCGGTFNKYNEARYCSMKCLEEARAERKREAIRRRTILIYREPCKHCGTTFYSRRLGRKYCGERCRYEAQYKKQRARINATRKIYIKVCKECISRYGTLYQASTVCSDRCSRRRSNRQKEVSRRHKLRENGPIDWDISIASIIHRDGTACYLCGSEVDISVHHNHSNAPSIEHVKAVANGGTHTWDNVRLAHRRCNWEKSDTPLEQYEQQ